MEISIPKFQFPYGNYFCLDVLVSQGQAELSMFAPFQFPYGNYFCLDGERGEKMEGANVQFQFPYGNYFCLDLRAGRCTFLILRKVSIPLRELFLFGQELEVHKEWQEQNSFNSLTGIIFVWTLKPFSSTYLCDLIRFNSLTGIIFVWTNLILETVFLLQFRFNSLTGIIFVWTGESLAGKKYKDLMFQFPYGNYFCLDLGGSYMKTSKLIVSIPLRELFLFGPV